MLRNFTIISTIILFVVLIAKFGLAMGGILFLFSMLVVVLIYYRVDYVMTISHYGQLYENIYVVSNHPNTDDSIDLPELNELIVCCKYHDVMTIVDEQKKWLTESKNPFFVDPALTDRQRLQVIPIIYQDGKYVNESWRKFAKRVKAEIQEDRANRHEMLKKTNNDWYMKYSNHQKNVNWGK